MKFCEKCGNLLFAEKKRKNVVLICRKCGKKSKAKGSDKKLSVDEKFVKLKKDIVVIDKKEIHERTRLPIIVINRKHPDIKKVKDALKMFDDCKERLKMVENAGKVKSHTLPNGKKIYYQVVGLNDEEAKEIINLSTTHSFIPEPLRVAHMVATAIVKGESKGRA